MTDTLEIPAEVWTQEGPNGGALDGALPRVVQAVAVTGVVTMREVPSLSAVTFALTALAQGTTVHLLGQSPQRRRTLISATVDIILSTDKGQAQAGQGLLVKANLQPVELRACEDLYAFVTGAGPGAVHVWAEVDPG